MKIDFSRKLKGLAGKDMLDNGAPVTLGGFVGMMLGQAYDKQPDEERLRAGRMAMQVFSGGIHDIPAKDIAMAQAAVLRHPVNFLAAQAHDMLEG